MYRKINPGLFLSLWDPRKDGPGSGRNGGPSPLGGDHFHPLSFPWKLNHATSETKSLQRSLLQAQDKKAHLEDEILAYEDRMKKLNMELKKLQGFHQQSELEVRAARGSGCLPVRALKGRLLLPKLFSTKSFPLANGSLHFCALPGDKDQCRGALCWLLEIKYLCPLTTSSLPLDLQVLEELEFPPPHFRLPSR